MAVQRLRHPPEPDEMAALLVEGQDGVARRARDQHAVLAVRYDRMTTGQPRIADRLHQREMRIVDLEMVRAEDPEPILVPHRMLGLVTHGPERADERRRLLAAVADVVDRHAAGMDRRRARGQKRLEWQLGRQPERRGVPALQVIDVAGGLVHGPIAEGHREERSPEIIREPVQFHVHRRPAALSPASRMPSRTIAVSATQRPPRYHADGC